MSLKIGEDKYLSAQEVAAILNVSQSTLRRWHIKNSLPCRKVGGRVYYDFEKIKLLFSEKAD